LLSVVISYSESESDFPVPRTDEARPGVDVERNNRLYVSSGLSTYIGSAAGWLVGASLRNMPLHGAVLSPQAYLGGQDAATRQYGLETRAKWHAFARSAGAVVTTQPDPKDG